VSVYVITFVLSSVYMIRCRAGHMGCHLVALVTLFCVSWGALGVRRRTAWHPTILHILLELPHLRACFSALILRGPSTIQLAGHMPMLLVGRVKELTLQCEVRAGLVVSSQQAWGRPSSAGPVGFCPGLGSGFVTACLQ
jgi:hypothetical protein